MNRILEIKDGVSFDESVTSLEWHSHSPYSSNSFNNSDEIRIPVHMQDVYTLPSRSFLQIEGKITKKADKPDDVTTELVGNCVAFLFD